jgi:choline dehydrogenase-like flavoprotein
MQPKSIGSVEIVSKDALIPPKLNLNLFTDGPGGTPGFAIPGTDAYLTVSFFKIVKAIATAAGETVIYPTPAQYAGGDAALFAAALDLSSLALSFHACATARMGTSKTNGVVDGNLNVFGVKNLMIADTSVMNPITSGNTCLPAYVVGLVAADVLGVPLS